MTEVLFGFADEGHLMRRGRGTMIDVRSDATSGFRRARGADRKLLPRIGRRRLARLDAAASVAEPTDEHRDREPPCLREDMIERVAHDLKNPLHTIALETTLLDDKLATPDADVRAALARISRNVVYLDRMVQDLLDCCSIASGHFELRRRPTELRALIAHVVDRVVSTRDSRRVWVEACSPVTVSVDAPRIERVIANLIVNALKYTPRSSLIGIRLEVHDGCSRISVIDDGPGMTVAETQCVFERYRRTLSGAAHDGSGLGLYISKQIVEAHGGTIGVSSVEGAGSRFHFELPMA
jgi:signal transduction histidine kinase